MGKKTFNTTEELVEHIKKNGCFVIKDDKLCQVPSNIADIMFKERENGRLNDSAGQVDCYVVLQLTSGVCEYHNYEDGVIPKKEFLNRDDIANAIIGKGITSIGNYAFYGCKGLTSVEIPNSVTSIGNWAFFGCTGLTSIEIPNSVTSIGIYAFWKCSGLTSITIPESVISIGDYSFEGCKGLTFVVIPNSVTSIGDFAFRKCQNLERVYIENPMTFRNLGNGCFNGCNKLTDIKIIKIGKQ